MASTWLRLSSRSNLLALGGALAFVLAAPELAQAQTRGDPGNTTTSPEATAPPTDRSLPPPTTSRPENGQASPQSVEEIVVTARKRNERLIDVPVSANALSSKALDKYAVTELTSAGEQVPQVRIDHAASGNGAIITIRGIGSASVDASIEQEVTVNIDGVPVSRGRVIQQAFFDQQSVEILKGPQALYFGKNAPAGVISITSTNPAKEFEGYGRAGYETTTDEYYGEFGVSLPITSTLGDRIAIRVSDMEGGYTRGIAGPITDPAQLPFLLSGKVPGTSVTPLPGSPFRDYPGDKEEVIRNTLQWKPTDKFDALLKFLVANHEDRGDSMAGRIFSCGPIVNHPASVDIGTGFTTLLVDPYGPCNINAGTNSYGSIPKSYAPGYRGSNGGVPYTQVLTYLGSLTANYHPNDNITLTSVTGFDKYREIQFSNYDETVFEAASGQNNDYNTTVTEELRLATSYNEPLNFTGGFFYEHDDREFYQEGSIGYIGIDPVTGKSSIFGSDDKFRNATYSVFGEANIKLPHRIELAGGLRYNVEDKQGYQETTLLRIPGLSTPVGERINNRFTEHNVSPQVTISWHPMNDVLIYGAYKTGFKSGGISAPALIPAFAAVDPSTQRFKLETVEGGEVGLKVSNLLGGRLTGDLTGYHYTYTGLQLTAFDAATTSYFTQNAAGATIEGIELNASYRITPELSLHGSAGYNRARYDSFPGSQCWTGQPIQAADGTISYGPGTPAYAQPALLAAAQGRYCVNGVQDLTGAQLSRAPNWSAIAGLSYERPIWRDYSLGLTADARYTGSYNLQTNNNPFAVQKEYTLVDLSARIFNDKWEFSLIARNVGDVQYAVLGGDKPLGPAGQILAAVGLPRQVFIQATRHF